MKKTERLVQKKNPPWILLEKTVRFNPWKNRFNLPGLDFFWSDLGELEGKAVKGKSKCKFYIFTAFFEIQSRTLNK